MAKRIIRYIAMDKVHYSGKKGSNNKFPKHDFCCFFAEEIGRYKKKYRKMHESTDSIRGNNS